MKELTLDAVIENVEVATAFVDAFLDLQDCPMKTKLQIDIAIDEIFSNIAYYAYQEQKGEVTVRTELQETPRGVSITFIDGGIPYNPLAKDDPDVTLSAEERNIGGLGIYMVKKNMDEVSYVYEKGHNQLTIKKYL